MAFCFTPRKSQIRYHSLQGPLWSVFGQPIFWSCLLSLSLGQSHWLSCWVWNMPPLIPVSGLLFLFHSAQNSLMYVLCLFACGLSPSPAPVGRKLREKRLLTAVFHRTVSAQSRFSVMLNGENSQDLGSWLPQTCPIEEGEDCWANDSTSKTRSIDGVLRDFRGETPWPRESGMALSSISKDG